MKLGSLTGPLSLPLLFSLLSCFGRQLVFVFVICRSGEEEKVKRINTCEVKTHGLSKSYLAVTNTPIGYQPSCYLSTFKSSSQNSQNKVNVSVQYPRIYFYLFLFLEAQKFLPIQFLFRGTDLIHE